MKSASKVQEICQVMVEAGRSRARNYALLNELYNGNPPWTEEEAAQDHQTTNVNWLEGTEKIHEARSQAKGALKSTENYFTVNLDTGPTHKKREWSMIITKEINRIMKRSRSYSDVIDSSVAQMIVQGIGPSTWQRRSDWCPKARSISDMLIPSGTLTSLDNLSHFAIRITFTANELIKQTTGDAVDKGWNQKLAGPLINKLCNAKPGEDPTPLDTDPTKWVEDAKENGCYYQSDKLPVLHCFDFFSFNSESGKWRRQIVLDCEGNSYSDPQFKNQFLYDNENLDFGKDVSNVLHAQIADGAVVAPHRWHSVRSLGYLLFPVCMSQNRVRCKFTDAVWESMMTMFRVSTESQREMIQKVDLRHHGIVPEGLTWVPPAERNQIDFGLVNGLMSMNRQLISESASSYTQGINDGTQKEMTATETMARLSSANRLQSAILSNIYDQQIPQYREILRRFFQTDHADCVAFRNRCQSKGVDKAMFVDVESCDVIPERAVGGGDRMLQIAMGDRLMSLSPKMNPQAQNLSLHIAVEATTGDSALANELVPLEREETSPSAEKATLSWGTLIDNKPVVIAGDINRIEFFETLIKLVDIELQQLNAGQGEPPPVARVKGLMNVMTVLKGILQQIATDESQADRVRQYADQVGQAENFIKGFIQQIQQATEAQGQEGDPKVAAELKAMEIKANSAATVQEHIAEQKLRHKELGFQQDQARRDQKTAAEIQNAAARTQVELAGRRAMQMTGGEQA